MEKKKRILVAEDELTNALLLKRLLSKSGYDPIVTHNGVDALKKIEKEEFDVLLTDWMMPRMDGIELIRRVRERVKSLPLIIMVTALVSESAKNYSLDSGADDYVAKPIDVEELLTRIKDGLKRKNQEINVKKVKDKKAKDIKPPFVGVGIAASTGGPPTLVKILKDMPTNLNAAYFIVQHGPPWMLETFADRLQRDTELKVYLAEDGMKIESGSVYIAPGDRHMIVSPDDYIINLKSEPKENFVRPAADPLFRSIAESFGKFSVASILTGLGKDGTNGAAAISESGGKILVQNPESSVAPSMPRTLVESNIKRLVLEVEEFAKALSETIYPLAALLKKSSE